MTGVSTRLGSGLAWGCRLDTLQLLLPYPSSSRAAVSVHHRPQCGFLTHRIPAQPQAIWIPCSYWFLTHRHHRQQYLSRQSTTFVGLVAGERIPPNGGDSGKAPHQPVHPVFIGTHVASAPRPRPSPATPSHQAQCHWRQHLSQSPW